MNNDPDQMNDLRADWANTAIKAFCQATGADPREALADLLCDLRHWADRIGKESFDAALCRANEHHLQETNALAQSGE